LDLLGEAEKRDLIRSKPGQITCKGQASSKSRT
jgi:hypothetical protein